MDKIATSFPDSLNDGFKVLGLGLPMDLQEYVALSGRSLSEDGVETGAEEFIPDLFAIEIGFVGTVYGHVGEGAACSFQGILALPEGPCCF